MIVNGVRAKTTKLRLFPGTYQFTTGSPNISWGDSGLLVIQSPSDYPSGVTDLRPKLSAAGEKAFVAAVTANVNKCLKSNKVKNPGCPNNVGRVSGGVTPKEGTFEWEATEKDALDSMEPRTRLRERSRGQGQLPQPRTQGHRPMRLRARAR